MTSDSDYTWDIFLAHASKDRETCCTLADALERAGARVYLDARELDAAAEWDRALPTAQEQSRVTLVYVTRNTPEAWYQRAEIARAITQHRAGARQHELIPLWGAGNGYKPYGVEHLTGIDPSQGVEHVVNEVVRVLETRFGVEPRSRFGGASLPGYLLPGLRPRPSRDAAPSQLVVAQREVVPFAGRARELNELDAWAERPGISVKLVHGPGGAGKTRLALEWLKRRRAGRDVAGVLRGDGSKELARELLAQPARLIIGVDYAETRSGLRELLMELAAAWERGGTLNVKLLLLGRHDGDWWGALKTDSSLSSWLEDTAKLDLGPLVDEAARPDEFARAATAFAGFLGAAVPAPPTDLHSTIYQRTVFIHISALLAVLGHTPDSERLLDGLLEREQQFWRKHAAGDATGAWTERQAAFERALCALTLRGGADAASDLDPWLAPILGVHATAFRKLLEHHYDRGATRWRDGLQPDVLGEHLVWRVLSGHPHGPAPGAPLVEASLAEPNAPWSTAFTVLARAEPDHPRDIGPWLLALVQGDPQGRAIAAVEGARAAGTRTAHSTLGLALAKALSNVTDPELATHLERMLPEASVSLRELAVWTLQVQLAHGSIDAPERGRLLNNLGNSLTDLGKREAALEATSEAVAIRRELALARPDAFLPDLAMSLNNLGNILSNLGRHEGALEATSQAVATYRELALARPDAFLPPLASSLNNLGIRLSNLGRREAALEATSEAVAIRRELALARPDAFLPDLGMSLNNLGVRLSKLGRHEAALEATSEAVATYRELALARPDAFLPHLGMSLNNVGNRLSNLGRREAALEATSEAVAIRRELALARPDAFLPDLAMSLNNLGNSLTDVGRREAALEATSEAVAIRRELALARPDAFSPDLATCLNNLGIRLSNLGRREAALEATSEAVAIRRELALARPDAFLPDLAMSLNNLGNILSNLGRREAALEATSEAVAIYRELAHARPDAFLPSLARGLATQGQVLLAAGDPEAACQAFCEGARLLLPSYLHLPGALAGLLGALLKGAQRSVDEGASAPADLLELLRELERGSEGFKS